MRRCCFLLIPVLWGLGCSADPNSNGQASVLEPVFAMHDLMVERFYEPQVINGMKASNDGPLKTFTLRGLKDSPPFLHDGRLLTMEDTVEFFNLVQETRLTQREKNDLLAFLYTL